jgi:hypothetical protein
MALILKSKLAVYPTVNVMMVPISTYQVYGMAVNL